MYTVVDGIATMNSEFDVLVIGQRGVGKSTMLRKYVMGSRNAPDFESSECLIHKTVKIPSSSGTTSSTERKISILDSSAGVDTLLTQNSYQVNNARTIVFAFSAGSSESFECLEYTINCIEAVRDKLPPCVVVSLKRDQEHMSQVSTSQGEALAKSCGAVSFAEVNLYDDSPVDEVFMPLVEILTTPDNTEKDSEIPETAPKLDVPLVRKTPSFDSGDTLVNSRASKAPLIKISRNSSTSQCGDKSSETNTESSDDHQEIIGKCDDFTTLTTDRHVQRKYTRGSDRLSRNNDETKTSCCIIM